MRLTENMRLTTRTYSSIIIIYGLHTCTCIVDYENSSSGGINYHKTDGNLSYMYYASKMNNVMLVSDTAVHTLN